jgi:predicted ferric reductase
MAVVGSRAAHVERAGATWAFRGAAWVVVYALVAVVPLTFALIDAPAGRGFWRDLSVGLGFVGLSMLGLQFAVTARIKPISSPYGLDALLGYHRLISFVATAFIVAHPLILVLEDGRVLQLFNPVTAPWRARLGLVALVAVLAIVITSVWRTRLGLRYETWRVVHGALAVAAVGSALGHVGLVGYYVSTAWKAWLWIAMSVTLVGLLGWVRVVKPLRMLAHPYRVTRVDRETDDIWTVVLRPHGHEGLRFQAGQFAWLTIGNSPFDVEEHPFSFSSSAERPDELAFTIKSLGDFTSEIGEVEPGTTAYVDGPYGIFTTDRNEAPGFVFVVGGIGITPVMSILRTLADRADPRPVLLVYADTAHEAMAFRDELARLERALDLEVVHVLEEPHEGWEGEVGYVTEELLERVLPEARERHEYFVCGPPPMIRAVSQGLGARGVPSGRIHAERFDLV